MAEIKCGNIYGYSDTNTTHGYYDVYFGYDSIKRNSSNDIEIVNAYIKCVNDRNGYTTNTITISSVKINGVDSGITGSFKGSNYWNNSSAISTTWKSNIKSSLKLTGIARNVNSTKIVITYTRTGSGNKTTSGTITVPYGNYTVTYNGNGGLYKDSATWVDPTKPTYASNYTTYSNANFFVRPGYKWVGWKDQNGTNWTNDVGKAWKWSYNYDVTLYAQWEPYFLTINFHSNGADYVKITGNSNGVTPGEYSGDSANNHIVTEKLQYETSALSGLSNGNNTEHIFMSRTGYHYKIDPTSGSGMWNTRADGLGTSAHWGNRTQKNMGELVKELFNIDFSSGNKTLDLFMMWEAAKLTVVFHNADNTKTATQVFTYGLSGNKFGYTNSNLPEWDQTGDFGGWSYEGHRLLHWFDNDNNTYDIYRNVEDTWIAKHCKNTQGTSYDNNSIDLYSIWEPVKLTVNYKYTKGTNSIIKSANQTFTYGEIGNAFGKNNDGTFKWGNNGQFGNWDRIGYTLLGWSEKYSNKIASYNPYSNVENRWLAEKCIEIVSGQKTDGSQCERLQYVDSDTILYTIWDPIDYEIKFNANGGSGTMSSQIFVFDIPEKLDTNTFTRDGYTFIGWSRNPEALPSTCDFSNNEEIEMSVLSADGSIKEITLYAIWSRNSNINALYVKYNNSWYRGEVFVNTDGKWYKAENIHVSDNGVWIDTL